MHPPPEERVAAKGRGFLSQFLEAERRIFAYILALSPRRSDAEDLFQEASMIMWKKFDEDNPPDDFVAWGCRIAYFKIRDYRKGQVRQRVTFSDAMLERMSATLATEATTRHLDERGDALEGCLGKLGRRDRDLLAERLREGATAQTAAERTGRSVAAVYKAMARIRRSLGDCVSRTLAMKARA
jgi:RNA polymerase sigma-70 factor (ECF subfamily)